MAINTKIKATVSLVASLFLYSGMSTSVLANDIDLHQAAKVLGLLQNAPVPPSQWKNTQAQAAQLFKRQQQARQLQYQNRQRQQNNVAQRYIAKPNVKLDPYAAKRLQIQRQNIARKKAYHARLAQLQRQKYQRIHSQRKQQQNNHGNVWNRLYNGFKVRNYNYQPLVKRYTKEFSRSPKRVQQLADRSSPYLYMVVNELNRRNMPTELALLPFVESAYRNKAFSHAGAAGMWQFIPATGRRFGLQQTRSYDARLDPFQATRAALDYLQRLNKEFRGDWLLSLAAYNAGEYRVHREIAKNRARGKRTDYWSLNLPKETRQYVPRLLAYKEIFRNPRNFRVQLRGIPNTTALTQIQVNKPVDLKRAALVAGLPADTLSSLNPGFLHGITTPRHSNRILLPRQHAGRLNQVIQKLPPAADVHNKPARRSYKRSRGRYTIHKVRSGDNLYRIARKHGISVKRLKRLNNLRSNKIWPGKRLKITSKSRKRKSYS